jgi:hypothetical protein
MKVKKKLSIFLTLIHGNILDETRTRVRRAFMGPKSRRPVYWQNLMRKEEAATAETVHQEIQQFHARRLPALKFPPIPEEPAGRDFY